MTNDDYWSEDEPLLDGLDDLPSSSFELPVGEPGAREELFRRTAAVLRWRRARHYGVLAAGWILMFAMGFAAARMAPRGVGSGEDGALDFHVAERTTGAGPTDRDASAREEGEPDVVSVPAALEGSGDPELLERLSGEAAVERKGAFLRRAGDLYLADRGDVQSALRCYQRLLDESDGSDDDVRRVGSDDSWLLIELKRNRP